MKNIYSKNANLSWIYWQHKILRVLCTHSCMDSPPNVPSQPLLVSSQPDFLVQHIPPDPHQAQGPCRLLQQIKQSIAPFQEFGFSSIGASERNNTSFDCSLLVNEMIIFLDGVRNIVSSVVSQSVLEQIPSLTTTISLPLLPLSVYLDPK